MITDEPKYNNKQTFYYSLDERILERMPKIRLSKRDIRSLEFVNRFNINVRKNVFFNYECLFSSLNFIYRNPENKKNQITHVY